MKKLFGYTLIELMTALAVVSILVSVGLPVMNVFFDSNRMISNTNEIVAGLHIARSEAIKQQSRVTMCQSTDQATCTNTGRWEDGFVVFVDNGGAAAGNAVVDPGERVLRVNDGADGLQVTIRSNGGLNQITNSVTYTSRGLPKATNGVAQSGLFRVCDERGLIVNADGASTVARGVVLSLSGRVRSTKNVVKIASCP